MLYDRHYVNLLIISQAAFLLPQLNVWSIKQNIPDKK